VKQSGITRVSGDVVIDDRLFTPKKWPDGLISPIWVNENLIDIEVTPGAAAGQATTIDYRPKTASYSVTSEATTVAAGETTALQVTEPSPGKLVVKGKIAVAPRPARGAGDHRPISLATPRSSSAAAGGRQRHGLRNNPRHCCHLRTATSRRTSWESTCPRTGGLHQLM
jgi:hypothetical protein